MTEETAVVMSAEQMARAQFRANALDLIVDIGLLSRWVLDRRFPLPEEDPYTSCLWSTVVWSSDQFDRLAEELAADGPVQRRQTEKHRTVTRRFGGVTLQVVQSLGVQA